MMTKLLPLKTFDQTRKIMISTVKRRNLLAGLTLYGALHEFTINNRAIKMHFTVLKIKNFFTTQILREINLVVIHRVSETLQFISFIDFEF